MSSPRTKRPELERQAPIRKLGGSLEPAMNGVGSAETGGESDASPPPDIVTRGVELGYRVIEDYMRQGQTFARTAASQRAPSETPAPDPKKLTERMFQYASDLAAVWLEYAQTSMGQQPASGVSTAHPAAPHVGGFDMGPGAASTGASAPPMHGSYAPSRASLGVPAVSVDIVSNRRTEVTVELRAGAAQSGLSAHHLRRRDLETSRISGVTIDCMPAENRVVVRLEVLDDHPAGTYTGLIVDSESNLPQGTLSVRVHESSVR
jgi:hypothetical protein